MMHRFDLRKAAGIGAALLLLSAPMLAQAAAPGIPAVVVQGGPGGQDGKKS